MSTGLGFFKGHRGAGVPHCVFSSKRDRSAKLEILPRLTNCYVLSASQCYCKCIGNIRHKTSGSKQGRGTHGKFFCIFISP